MENNIIDKMLQDLKDNGNAIHIENLDIMFDLPNKMVESIKILAIILTKISCLPLIPNFAESNVYQSIGLLQENATMVQELNEQLIHIHTALQKYTIEQYVVQCMSKKMLDDTVLNLPKKDITNLLNFIKNYHEAKNDLNNIQTGGQLDRLIKTLIYFASLLTIITPSTMVAPIDGSNPSTAIEVVSTNVELQDYDDKLYTAGISDYYPNEFTTELTNQYAEQLQSSPEYKSQNINVNTMITQYDKKYQEDLKGMTGWVKNYFNTYKNGQESLEAIFREFNNETSYFSRNVESICIELMTQAKEYGIFEEFKSFDTASETIEKLNSINNAVREETANAKNSAIADVTGAVASAISSGDLMTPIAFFGKMALEYNSYISNTQRLDKQKKQVLTDVRSKSLQIFQPSERSQFERNLYDFTKLYCSNGYYLKIELLDDSFVVVGDKVSYEYIISLISQLHSNIRLKKETLTGSSDNNDILTMNVLESLMERLKILEEITYYLRDMVKFKTKSKVERLQRIPSDSTIDEFKQYIKDEISNLKGLLTRLNMTRPISQKLMTEKENAMIAEQELKNKEQNILHYENKVVAERGSRDISAGFSDVSIYASAWSDVISGTVHGLSSSATKVVTSAAEGGWSTFLASGNKILYETVTNPSGWVIISALFFAGYLSIKMSGIPGAIFQGSKGLFLILVVNPCIFVYKMVKTSFGYMYCKCGTLVLQTVDYGPYGKENYEKYNMGREEGEEYNSMKKYGGKLKKWKKTRKNKKRRTRKYLYRKRRQTRNRRLTRRR
jgi:hypothetical protein